ncbi:MAG TPA: hypothetical protein VJZ26_18745 [Blastocatellia bacterium]|nr:hypothetical protein [Blastocatellia bacterium]
MGKRVEPHKAVKEFAGAVKSFIRRKRDDSDAGSKAPATLKIARYNLILMDNDGQVVWTGEWGVGDVFEFGPRYSLWVFCEFTNHSNRETEVAEYEIELVSEEGQVVERFGNAFGDSIIVAQGQSRVFSGQWRL